MSQPQQFDISKLETTTTKVSPKEGMSPAIKKFLAENSKKATLNPSASENPVIESVIIEEPTVEAVVVNPEIVEETTEIVEEETGSPDELPVDESPIEEEQPSVADTPSVKGTRGVVQVSSQFYSSGKLITEKSDELVVPINPFPKDAPLAQVNYQSGLTINLGNYNSAKISVSITLPTTLDQINDCYKAAQEFVDTKVSEESEKIQDYRNRA